jgi:prevent-host-death family protein
MDSINATEAREFFAEVLNRVSYRGERVRITRHGKEVAAVVPIEDLELLERLQDEADVRDAEAALADAKEHGAITWEDAKRALGL